LPSGDILCADRRVGRGEGGGGGGWYIAVKPLQYEHNNFLEPALSISCSED